MNGLFSMVGWALLHSLWQGALIGILCGGARFLTSGRSAKIRYGVACAGLVLLPLLPLLTVLNQPIPMPVSGQAIPAGTALVWLPSTPLEDLPLGQQTSLFSRLAELCARLAPWLAPIWLFGVFVCSARLLQNCWWLRTVRFQSYEPEEPELIRRLNSLRRKLRIHRPVRLLQSALVDVPTVIGWLRPVILLPFSSLVGLAPQQVEAILVHELAHIRRFDHLVNVFQCLVETLMFYHPAVWWLTQWVREERENCCDDMVVAVCGDRLAYARALATLEEFRAPLSPLALAATGGSLLARIRRLLGGSRQLSLTPGRRLCGLGLFLLGLLCILMGTGLAFATPLFKATARIKLASDQRSDSGDGEQRAAGSDLHFRYALQTQQTLIASHAVLSKVIGDLDLTHAWQAHFKSAPSLDQLVGLLRNRLTIRSVRQTMLMDISAADERPELAAAIANRVVEAYRNFLWDDGKAFALARLEGLQKRFNEMEDKVRHKQDELEQVRKDLHLPATDAQGNPPLPRSSAETLRRLEQLRIDTQSQISGEEMLLQRLRGLNTPELLEVLPTAAPDVLLQSLLEQQSLVEQRLLAAKKDYGPNHAEVEKSQSMAEGLRDKIKRRSDGILLGLTTRVEALKSKLATIEKEIARATNEDLSSADQYSAYSKTRTELEEMQRFRQILYLKLASEKVDSASPGTAFAVVDPAVIPSRPAPQTRPAAFGLILVGLLLDGLSLAVLRGRPRLEAASV